MHTVTVGKEKQSVLIWPHLSESNIEAIISRPDSRRTLDGFGAMVGLRDDRSMPSVK